jgi:single-stranded-DNA-specific exonuclease
MSNAPKRWQVANPAPPAHLARYRGMSPVLAQVLYNRGLEDAESAFQFLFGDPDFRTAPSFNPFVMKGMNKAVDRIRRAIRAKEPVVIYGDFDADGVTATTLLMQALRALGADVRPYIPHRIDEGYGLNLEALNNIFTSGVKLVITVDCGIRSIVEAAWCKTAGLDIIITDHHSVGPEIPDALAVINPKQVDCKYPEKMLAGVGIAYKLADALFRATAQDKKSKQPDIPLEHLLDLVAIGTVADLAPMDKLENRALVRRGLDVINNGSRPGVRALVDVAGVKDGVIDSERIGFALGPRINAAGRLGSALTAFELLMAETPHEAGKLANELHELNRQRQELTRQAQDVVRQRMIERGETEPYLIFEMDESFQEGIVGLVAGRLTEEFYRPAVVLHRGEHESRASCRSIPQFDITRALDQCADLLVRHGGHAQAAGLTVMNGNIDRLRAELTRIAEAQLAGEELAPTLDIDAEIPYALLDLPLAEELEKLQPTGYHNAAPIFMTRNLEVLEARPVGKDEGHLKLRLARPGHTAIDGIGFGLGALARDLRGRVDVAYQLDINVWNDKRSAQLVLQDVRASGS